METRKIVYFAVSIAGLAFLAYFTLVRRTEDGVPAWLWVIVPFAVVGLIGYDVWYRRTKT